MKITCPNNPDHNKFSVTAHVTQLWQVDEEGKFVKELKTCEEVTHYPDKDDYYICETCGTEAVVEK